MEQRPMSHSRTIVTKLVLPPDTNHMQTIFGGKVLAYIDEIAAIAAMKHSNKRAAVTASIDSVDFLSSAKVGDVLELEAVVSSTGRTSMEVFVTVHSRDLVTGATKLTTESFLTMVAMDENNKPTAVPGIYPETEAEKRLFDTGPARRDHRRLRREIIH
ncbi:acyl-CoA thioesterase [Sporosarcina thermotolerans]|uniref:Acyl-CoA thioesterase n=1 Tax=Sporosarcina thermotolerans TaxID=633404 RepID=A0AAW9AAL2_9BACL|nr:acyl-CoA thioesterase [Sporosarcina thermotolerans]MDW0116631.1 acyl-CoA thioesterase [Sporosarcina thermotolerans]WHT48835.1 acyl-CoA thioesterase [Sporosarcina thermotolerans]